MVEEETRRQSSSKIWYDQRSGRVTSSRLYGVLHIYKQIKTICITFKSHMLSWSSQVFWCGVYGCQHEDEARSIYGEMMKKDHDTFTISQYGVLLDPTNPFMGASPDGVV